MLLTRKLASKSFGCKVLFPLLILIVFAYSEKAIASEFNKAGYFQDTTAPKGDTLPYPIQDRRGDFISTNRSTFDLDKPANIQDSIAFDAATRKYIVYEKIGRKYYRTPTWYTYDEFMALQGRKAEVEYFKKRANTLNVLNRGLVKPKLKVYDNLFNRLFGNGKIEIQPQGNVDIT
ncbi:MAG: hypothetical protein H0V14_07890, partial [Chitinophagaceae bacterium]|nr:hypothetical protein [Chitinophagaceae bacterium]